MKIYDSLHLIKLQISQQGSKTEHLLICETTLEETEAMCKRVIESKNLSIFANGNRTSISIRENIGNGKDKTKVISFKGLEPKDTLNEIIQHIKAIEK